MDADALIKLHRAGVLEHIARTFECLIPPGVYHEVVTRGREFQHSDADAIARIIQSGIAVRAPESAVAPGIIDAPGIDIGEKDLLRLFYSMQGEDTPTLVSDDRRFLTLLNELAVPALIPADFVVLMARQGFLAKGVARNALELMRPSIRETAYRQAVRDLEE